VPLVPQLKPGKRLICPVLFQYVEHLNGQLQGAAAFGCLCRVGEYTALLQILACAADTDNAVFKIQVGPFQAQDFPTAKAAIDRKDEKGPVHNHFCFNSVSFKDGKKYNYSKAERQRLRDTSDRLCLEYGLSVIEHGRKAPSRPVWLDEQSGKPTRYNIYRADVREAVNGSRTVEMMEKYLRRKGYLTDFTGKHWKIRLPQYQHFTRLDTLDERWTPENIGRSLGTRASFGNKRPTVNFAPELPEELRVYVPFQRTSHIYRLFLYWEYQLGILPKGTTYQPTSPFMKEELRKLDTITAQVDYLAKNRIEVKSRYSSVGGQLERHRR